MMEAYTHLQHFEVLWTSRVAEKHRVSAADDGMSLGSRLSGRGRLGILESERRRHLGLFELKYAYLKVVDDRKFGFALFNFNNSSM